MKKITTLFTAVILAVNVFAQSPLKMSYQAVIRHSDGSLVTSHPVGMRITILQGSETGTTVFTETQTVTTNENGLVSLEIGNGTYFSGGLSTIDWSTGPYFIKTETDVEGGTNYSVTGTSQLMSVPYALYAAKSGNPGISSVAPTGTTPNGNGATVSGTTLTLQPASENFGGIVTTDAQNFSGAKHFYSPVSTEGTLTVGNDFSGSGRVNILSNNNEFSDPIGVQFKIDSYVKTFTGMTDTVLPFYSVADINASYLGVSNNVTFDEAAALHLTAPWGGGYTTPLALKTDGSVKINGNMDVTGTWKTGTITYPNTNGNAGDVLQSDGAGNATWTAVSGIQTADFANAVSMTPSTSGHVFYTQWSGYPIIPEDLPVGYTCTIVNFSNYDATSVTLNSTKFVHAGVGFGWGGVTNFTMPSGGTVRLTVMDIDGQKYYFLTGDIN
jgi:hypothetical protein